MVCIVRLAFNITNNGGNGEKGKRKQISRKQNILAGLAVELREGNINKSKEIIINKISVITKHLPLLFCKTIYEINIINKKVIFISQTPSISIQIYFLCFYVTHSFLYKTHEYLLPLNFMKYKK